MNTKRRTLVLLLLTLGLVISGCKPGQVLSPSPAATSTPALQISPVTPSIFVTAQNGKFMLNSRPYYYVGVNFWQGMNLGVDNSSGNRTLLTQELDQMQQLGITNLRVMASSEGPNTEPHRMVPALETSPGVHDATVLDGLDFLLVEMGKRGMRAVMVLNNFWYWSGGMAQYVSWHDGTPIPYPGDYNTYENYASRFYYCAECQTWYRNHIRTLIDHVNPYTGEKYRDNPTIFSWELANEPRRYSNDWIFETAAYIKSLDPNHMITTGSEGTPPGENIDFIATHSSPNIDYATIHIWPQNWGWYDPSNPSTFATAEANAHLYLADRIKDAGSLDKPLVLEEFGLARDWEPVHNIYNQSSPTTFRDQFYKSMFDQDFASMSAGGPVGGDNFWAWAGRSRPGDPWIGDPPHETPGWYSVYDTDASTLAVISAHAKDVAGLLK